MTPGEEHATPGEERRTLGAEHVPPGEQPGTGGADPSTVAERLAAAGHVLPAMSPPLASYQPAKRIGTTVLTAGQLPMRDGQLIASGRVGQEIDLDTARACARQATLNALAAVATVVDLAEVAEVVQLVGYVACPADFTEQPQVLNAASDLLVTAFGDPGRHVRSALGVASLPLGSPIEIELVVALR